MTWDWNNNLWKIEGIIPKSYKIFKVNIVPYKSNLFPYKHSRFPRYEGGSYLKPQSYSISGAKLKKLISSASFCHDRNKPTDESVYMGYGLSATNLDSNAYQSLKDNDVLDVIFDGDEWEIHGIIPYSNQAFTVNICEEHEL